MHPPMRRPVTSTGPDEGSSSDQLPLRSSVRSVTAGCACQSSCPLLVCRGGPLRERLALGAPCDLPPRHVAGLHGIRGVHEVGAVQGGPAGPQGQREHHRGQVAVAHQPGRLGRRDVLEVEQTEDLDRQLATPRGHDGGDRRVGQHGGQLARPVGRRCAHHAPAVHALPHDDVEPLVAQRLHAEAEARPQGAVDPAGGGRHADAVTGTQGAGIAGHSSAYSGGQTTANRSKTASMLSS